MSVGLLGCHAAQAFTIALRSYTAALTAPGRAASRRRSATVKGSRAAGGVWLTLARLPAGGCAAGTTRLSGSEGCATTVDGTTWCWGSNHYGQLGDLTTTDRHKPVQVVGINGVYAGGWLSTGLSVLGGGLVVGVLARRAHRRSTALASR